MTGDNIHKLQLLCRQLTENLMSAALCANELSAIAHAKANIQSDLAASTKMNGRHSTSTDHNYLPLLDETTLSVIWCGRSVRLGHTQAFRLLACLSKRANQYVTHLDLLREVWDDEFADTSLLRTAIKRLRRKLQQEGMSDLSQSIMGHHGHYILDLDAIPRHKDVTAIAHRKSRA